METQKFEIAGLEGGVEVIVDRWGVPHIYAEHRKDVFVGQGFVAAYNRLFQMDLWRRWGLGRLAEVLGEEYLERDRAARLFLYRGDMRSEWLAYGSGVKAVAEAFVAGINGFVDQALRDRCLLPREFELLEYDPDHWSAADIARIRVNGLRYNLDSEVERARLTVRYGTDIDELRFAREPFEPLEMPEDLVAKAVEEDVLRTYRLAVTPPPIVSSNSGEKGRTGVARDEAQYGSASNNWVISGNRTESGRPILANDPHRMLGVPSLRFVTHLIAPGCNVIGAGEPSIPGLSIGHNENVAFGLTIMPIDQEDLYVYEVDPARPGLYQYRGSWESFDVRREVIEVRGTDSQEVELRYTRHGPLIHEDLGRGVACAARLAWLEPGMAPYLGSVHYMNATSGEEFALAMDRWGAPGENQVYADVEGNIGVRPAGLIPRRRTWSGLLPVTGDGSHEWEGFVEPGTIRGERNPDRGWVATANQRTVTWEEWEQSERFCYEWYSSYRFERVQEVLTGIDRVGMDDCTALQLDVRCLPALELIARVREIVGDGGMVREDARWAWEELARWDGEMAAPSRPAAIFEVWHRRYLRPEMLRLALEGRIPAGELEEVVGRLLPDETLAGDSRVDLWLLSERGPVALSRAAVEETLCGAVAYLEREYGSRREEWRWGALHVAAPKHAIQWLTGSDTKAWELPALERSGNGETVNATASGTDFKQTAGASFRMVLDVGEWDASVFINAPGQSGDPRSAHYCDHWRAWGDGQYFPLVFSRAAVEGAAASRMELRPVGEAGSERE